VFILETGKVVHQGTPAEIEADTARLQQFLGVH
jgi:ABC-type branched-subunit amino acid transport system ATPase component